jgi:predicted enzyme involved in methoxymalonyl-ACP biosynthesis
VQGKRVEHATLSYLLKRFGADVKRDFYANYRKSAKNAVSGKVFGEMGFEQVSEDDGVSLLVFRETRQIPDDKVVRIVAGLQ